MKTFYMTVTETLKRTLAVQAETAEEAYYKAEDACNDGVAELDWSDFIDREITDDTEHILNLYEPKELPKFQEIK